MSTLNVSVKASGGSLNWSSWYDDFSGPCVTDLANGVPQVVMIQNNPGASGVGGLHQDLTWEQIGVPAGSTITGISACSLGGKCIEHWTGGHKVSDPSQNQINPATITDGSTVIVLSVARPFSQVESSFVTASGIGASGLSLPSTDVIELRISANLLNGGTQRDVTAVQMDNLVFTVEYQ